MSAVLYAITKSSTGSLFSNVTRYFTTWEGFVEDSTPQLKKKKSQPTPSGIAHNRISVKSQK